MFASTGALGFGWVGATGGLLESAGVLEATFVAGGDAATVLGVEGRGCGAAAGFGCGAGVGAAATAGASIAAAGTMKGFWVKGQTTFDPADTPRTSTKREGVVKGVRTYPGRPGTACATGTLVLNWAGGGALCCGAVAITGVTGAGGPTREGVAAVLATICLFCAGAEAGVPSLPGFHSFIT